MLTLSDIKKMLDATNDEIQARLKSNKRWCCWQSAMFGRFVESWQRAVFNPELFVKGAEQDFASIAMTHFRDLYELDADSANMVFQSYKYDIAKMLDTLGERGERFHYMFSFTREKHPH